MDIINHKHIFFIRNHEIELTINKKDNFWTSEITKGNTGTGICSGGSYKDLDEYIADKEKLHRYSFDFFGYY